MLAWYRAGHRDLPWRKTRDPYAIWVSEIMLQQTRVETVVPYYTRFLEAFPTVDALAEAPLERVLALWSGLGYYRRARLLHAGAKAVALGGMPKTALALRTIPGIGAYTAGAIASIAYGLPAPVVDGNVARVIARVASIRGDVSRGGLAKTIWKIAAKMVRGEDPGAFNQALMELGATVCTPQKPRCDACPVAASCKAYRFGRTETIPAVRKKAKVKRWNRIALVAERGGAVLLARRKSDLVFGGLWEPPCIDGIGLRAASALLAGIGTGVLVREARVRHVLTHRDCRVGVWSSSIDKPLRTLRLPSDYDHYEWVTNAQTHALSTFAKKILAVAGF